MAKYRKKPVVIEAWQHFNDAGTHTNEIPRWIIDACSSGTIYVSDSQTFIRTLEGPLHVTDGDWIIKGVKNELYPCKPDIFTATYEPAE